MVLYTREWHSNVHCTLIFIFIQAFVLSEIKEARGGEEAEHTIKLNIFMVLDVSEETG